MIDNDEQAQARDANDAAARRGATRLQRVLAHPPAGIFVDIDGTISPFAATPREAAVSPHARQLLQVLAGRARVVVVSGRTLVDARRMVGLSGITYVGSHGLAMWVDGREEINGVATRYVRLAHQAMAELAPLRRIDGILFEEKTTGVAIHYRLTRDSAEARSAILRAISASGSAAHFDLLEGVRVVELRPRLGINKGTSVRTLAVRFALGGIVYVGDDLTDVDAFEAVRDRRAEGVAPGLTIAVRHGDSSGVVEAAADYVVDGVEGVERLLAHMLELLGGNAAHA